MASNDEGRIFYSYQNLEEDGAHDHNDDMDLASNSQYMTTNLKHFIVNYGVSLDEAKRGVGYYAAQLCRRQPQTEGRHKLEVDLEHVRTMNPEAALALEDKPTASMPLFEKAAAEVLRESYANNDEGERPEVGDVQILLYSSKALGSSRTCSIRDLSSDRVNKLVKITGITTAASRPRHKATRLTVQCQDCKATTSVACRPGLGGAVIPRVCTMRPQLPGLAEEQCKLDSMQVLPDRCEYVDQQTLKLQEKPEDVPTGEMPRTVVVVADRYLVNRVTPGTRIAVVGIYSTFRAKAMDRGPAALQQPYIHAVSIVEEAGDSHSTFNFTQEEIAMFDTFARQPSVHDIIFGFIAPNIFGSEDIKKAVASLLFGGARKTMPDGTSRRGDVNILLLGDPSTAKSQFLKYASKVAPISVYTSGKGSSAAGLTASVIQDPNTREFYLEGGAMVLADNGVVCIDEFDKMRPEDRVAIHEAMEQQTISIAKAGITTMLKSRTSVLAAANPPSGRYDDLKSAQDNIDLQSTILSRFDLIFIVKDPQTVERDKAIAEKVLDNHRLGGQVGASACSREAADELAKDVGFLKRYIHYARSQCQPRLSEQAQERLAAYYVDIRDAARQACVRDETDTPPVPITVRQLEALIRISESLARMGLHTLATLEHVEMAIDLFKKSTMDAVRSGITTYSIDSDPQRQAIHRLEDKIRRRLHIGSYITLRRLMDEMVALGETESLVMRALVVMNQQGECEFRRERSVVHRVR